MDCTNPYYERIDLIDAFHPQTILAYEMNGAPFQLAYGAPLRLRVERQLGYKMAKFITRIEVVDRMRGSEPPHDPEGANGRVSAVYVGDDCMLRERRQPGHLRCA